MKLIAVGDTTYASDPLKGHHSYTVYATEARGRSTIHVLPDTGITPILSIRQGFVSEEESRRTWRRT